MVAGTLRAHSRGPTAYAEIRTTCRPSRRPSSAWKLGARSRRNLSRCEQGQGLHQRPSPSALSKNGEEYILDPIADLRPLCANCHAMIHNGPDVLSIEELKHLLRR